MDKDNDEEDDEIKVILLGDHGVGKTNLINTCAGLEFEEKTNATIGGSSIEKSIKIDNNIYLVNLWDTDNETITHSLDVVRNSIYPLLKEKLNCEGLTLAQNNELGQEIKHYHIHLIPRYQIVFAHLHIFHSQKRVLHHNSFANLCYSNMYISA